MLLLNLVAVAGGSVTWHPFELDGEVGIGYGVAVADVDGDGDLDVILADRDNLAWYENPLKEGLRSVSPADQADPSSTAAGSRSGHLVPGPGVPPAWRKHVLTGKLSELDHVCVAARDLDGDGRAEVAAGATWNPGDTFQSGSVHALVPGEDRMQLWSASSLPHEPTTHRMRWVRLAPGRFGLAVLPLHGRGNVDGTGEGVRILLYEPPKSPVESWTITPIAESGLSLHFTHNLDVVQWDPDPDEEILVAAREGVWLLDRTGGSWTSRALIDRVSNPDFQGASEVRSGRLQSGRRFISVVGPFHGNHLVLYAQGNEPESWRRMVLDDSLMQGHAIAVGDFEGCGFDQVAAGWRQKNADQKVGVKCYVPDADGNLASVHWVDDSMACEDLCAADFEQDGRLDLVASGRDSHNLRIYFNRSVERAR